MTSALTGRHYGPERCLIHESQNLAFVNSFRSKRLITSINEIRLLASMSLKICVHSKSYPNKDRYNHNASRYFLPYWFTQDRVNRDKRFTNKNSQTKNRNYLYTAQKTNLFLFTMPTLQC